MLRLDTGDGWVDFPSGVRVRLRPCTRGMKRRAKRRAARSLGDVDFEKIDMLELGDIGDTYTYELLRLAIVAWEGVGDDAGAPVELTPPLDIRTRTSDDDDRPSGTIDAFLADEDMFEAGDQLYVMPVVERDRAKNGLSVSPNGTGEAGTPAPDTAGSSAKPKPEGVVGSAPTASTTPKATPRRKSGAS